MKILFIGCVISSQEFLLKLIDLRADIVGVITKQESNFNADFADLSMICNQHKLDFMHTKDINNLQCLEYVKNKKPDVIFCFGWSQLIKQELLAIPPMGAIGFHPAELPMNRGRHPLIWAMALGLEKTASTFFYMVEQADAGGIISQKSITIDYEDTALDLYNKMIETAKGQIAEIVHMLENNNITVIESNKQGNAWRKRGKSDGKIDWRMSSRAIYNLVRALSHPYVGAHFEYKEKEYKVWKVKEVVKEGYHHIEPGKVLERYDSNSFLVKAYDNLIKIEDCDCVEINANEYL